MIRRGKVGASSKNTFHCHDWFLHAASASLTSFFYKLPKNTFYRLKYCTRLVRPMVERIRRNAGDFKSSQEMLYEDVLENHPFHFKGLLPKKKRDMGGELSSMELVFIMLKVFVLTISRRVGVTINVNLHAEREVSSLPVWPLWTRIRVKVYSLVWEFSAFLKLSFLKFTVGYDVLFFSRVCFGSLVFRLSWLSMRQSWWDFQSHDIFFSTIESIKIVCWLLHSLPVLTNTNISQRWRLSF